MSKSESRDFYNDSQFLEASPNTFRRAITEQFHNTRANSNSSLFQDPENFDDVSDQFPILKRVNQGAVENVEELSGTHIANEVVVYSPVNSDGVGVGIEVNLESERKTEVFVNDTNKNVENTKNINIKTMENVDNVKNVVKANGDNERKRKKKWKRICCVIFWPFYPCFWRKGDKVLPMSRTDIELNQTIQDKRKIKKKRRNCCLIILLIIIILLLLGNIVALDVRSFQPPLNSVNSTDTTNTTAPPPVQVKNAVCVSLFSAFALQPQQFPCDFCASGSDVAPNITDFCVLKGIWANAVNVTSIETVAGWMRNNEFCRWVGVTCDQGGRVVVLQLSFPNVPNVFIDNLGNLEKLSSLKITGNSLAPSGAFPTSLFNLKNLATIRLELTALSNMPDTFDKLSSLTSLQLIRNPSLGSTFPSSVASLSLNTLAVSGQNIGGAIPDVIGNSVTLQSSLQSLDLSFNQFTGTVPASLLQLKSLTSLTLGRNQLSGPIPALPTTLTTLDLNTNTFSGSIPTSLTQITGLTFLSLQANLLTGPIPTSITQLTKLTDLSLQSNKLSGGIPDGIGNMNILRLNLASNVLTGQ
ncbi:4775_t:CDS:2, partial [Paraglomus brasilianum]